MLKTNLGLVEYATRQIGYPYWWGTYGQQASKSLYEAKKKQYPNQYTATDFTRQFGYPVHDCVGLIKGYLWTGEDGKIRYTASSDKNVSGMLKMCSEKGDIKTIPELAGVLVFTPTHVGIYVGNGEVIEARGHAYGVVRTKLKNRPWEKWGKLDYLTYIDESEEEDMERYKDLKDIPDWGRDTIASLIEKSYLKGDGSALDLSKDMVRILVMLDRAGAFNK